MVNITKDEAVYLRSHGVRPDSIVRTMKQKSKRKRILCCEDRYIMELLDEYRKSQNVVYEYPSV